MSESVHKYHCIDCHIFIFGETVARLAINVNQHTTNNHPLNFAAWNAWGITRSVHYVPPQGTARPQYLLPHGCSQNTSEKVDRYITTEDRKFLAEIDVKW